MIKKYRRYFVKLFFSLFLVSISLLLNSCGVDTSPDERKVPIRAISDVDRANLPVINFSVGANNFDLKNNEVTVSEGASGFAIIATLSKPVDEVISFRFNLDIFGSTAENLRDFLLKTPNSDGQPTGTSDVVIFEPNKTTARIEITIVNDLLREEDEVLSLFIQNNPGGVPQSTLNLPDNGFAGHEIRINIEDDEPKPAAEITAIKISGFDQLPITNFNIEEGQEAVGITISLLNSLSEADLKVQFEILADSGVEEDVDYKFPFVENKLTPEGNISEIIFGEKESTIEFFINIYPDLLTESPETITFKLIATDDVDLPINGITEFSITITDAEIGSVALPDTGIDTCYGDTDITPCNSTEYPNQDANTNTNDAQFLKYNFVKASVNLAGQTQVSKSLPSDASSWECVYDKNTKLLWAIGMKFREKNELDTITSLRWFNPNPTNNGGNSGSTVEEGDDSNVSIAMKTTEFANLINSPGLTELSNESLCEVRNWRLPTATELLSLMDFETDGDTYADNTYFPFNYLPPSYLWTSTPSAIEPKQAWCVYFGKKIKNSLNLCQKVGSEGQSNNGFPALYVSTFKITTP